MNAESAKVFKDEQDAKIAELTKEMKALGTKASTKDARNELNAQIKALKAMPQYEDAKLICEGKEAKHGPGGYGAAAAVPAAGAKPDTAADKEEKEKKEKKPKKDAGGAGISPDERKELEKLKADIIARKAELKAEGMSGGQQNKDAQVVAWVTRMNELKEKECPGSTAKAPKKDDKKKGGKKGTPLTKEEREEFDKLKVEVEEYKTKLKTECGYTKKDMDKDPDLQEMLVKLKALEDRA